jgi:hypothetical protein
MDGNRELYSSTDCCGLSNEHFCFLFPVKCLDNNFSPFPLPSQFIIHNHPTNRRYMESAVEKSSINTPRINQLCVLKGIRKDAENDYETNFI